MSKKLLLIVNPCSGQKMSKRILADVVEQFCRADYIPTVFITLAPGDGQEKARLYGPEHDLVVCIGGDGTFTEAAGGLLMSGKDIPLGYIPCGSTNDFANSIKLNKKPLEAAKDIIEGSVHTYDMGQFGERYYSYIASFGAFTRASYATPQNVKNVLGHLAYILEGIKDVSAIRPYHLKVETADNVWEDDYIFGALSNSTSVGGVLTLDPHAVDMNDGLLELLLIRAPKNPLELADCVRALKNYSYDAAMVTMQSVTEVKITAPADMDWTLDGECAKGRESVTIRNVRNAIHLMCR